MEDKQLEIEGSRKMSDDFKQKLEAYQKGELRGNDLQAFEEELAMLEVYQTALEQDIDETPKSNPNIKKQQRIMFKGKWKARFQSALTVLGLFLVFTFFSSIVTNVYYTWGNPDRVDVYREIIDHTLTITEPFGRYGGTSTHTKAYFGLEATRDLNKVVGRDTIKVGEMNVNFLFSAMGYPERNNFGTQTQTRAYFSDPRSSEPVWSDWDKLEKLPEGTVVSAYISFDDLLETNTVVEMFSERDMDLLWLAVDKGEPNEEDYGAVFYPIGFPSMPIWHENDMIIESQETENGLFGPRVISESARSPDYEDDEEQFIIHQQFIKTLHFLKEHEKKVNNISYSRLNIDEVLNYIDQNGIQHYGAVITGPTKEILTLQNEPLISQVQVDEVEFWNWD